jgi:hypothetical protein
VSDAAAFARGGPSLKSLPLPKPLSLTGEGLKFS